MQFNFFPFKPVEFDLVRLQAAAQVLVKVGHLIKNLLR